MLEKKGGREIIVRLPGAMVEILDDAIQSLRDRGRVVSPELLSAAILSQYLTGRKIFHSGDVYDETLLDLVEGLEVVDRETKRGKLPSNVISLEEVRRARLISRFGGGPASE